jgi:hypothetical protein
MPIWGVQNAQAQTVIQVEDAVPYSVDISAGTTDVEIQLEVGDTTFVRLTDLDDAPDQVVLQVNDVTHADVMKWIALGPDDQAALRIGYSEPLAQDRTLNLKFETNVEPFHERNDTPETAQSIELGLIEARFFPERDIDVFAVTSPGDGALVAQFLERGPHSDARIQWLDADGNALRGDWESTLTTKTGEVYFLEIRGDNSLSETIASEEVVTLSVDFSPEPYVEPNNTVAEATPAELGQEIALRLMPRADLDVFAFTAPGDGAFLASFVEDGGHVDERFQWFDEAGTLLRGDWESSISVRTGARYFLEVRSDNNYWDQQAREDEVRVRVDFSAEPYNEPNDSIETAVAVAPGDLVQFRLMPRVDRDFFSVVAPSSGTLILEIIEDGGHPNPTSYWYDSSGTILADRTRSHPVEGGQMIFFLIVSDAGYWREQAREETVKIRVRLQRPDGSFIGESLLPNEVSLLPWERVMVPAQSNVPFIVFQPPQPGLYRLGGLPDTATVLWTDLETNEALEGVLHDLQVGRSIGIEVLEAGDRQGASTLVIELLSRSMGHREGLYTRSPLVAGRDLFSEMSE